MIQTRDGIRLLKVRLNLKLVPWFSSDIVYRGRTDVIHGTYSLRLFSVHSTDRFACQTRNCVDIHA
jgi:hypothetical protein